jgi:hypothetical protein
MNESRWRRWVPAACAFALQALTAESPAQEPVPPTPQPRASRLLADDPPLVVDGRLDDAGWRHAPVHDTFVQYLPVDRLPAPMRTTVQVLVDEHAITFGIRAYDPQPELIRAPLLRRDQVRRDQDFVAVMLDPAGTRRSAQFVRVNAAGVVADGMYIAETDTEDFAPDFEVDAAVHRGVDGYSVEIRMPLLGLRYPYEGGAPWRMMVSRSVPREASMLLLSAPLTKDALNFIAELQPVGGLEDVTERVRERAFLTVRPELTMRSTRGSEPADRSALGAEIKWRPRADWVFDATLNPDFSQVELDVPQLAGNTRFALSVEEKRPFFLESTDVLDLPLASFYSRSVTDPRWGLRATWRGADADATGLSLNDDGGGLVLRPGAYGTGVALQDRRSQATLLRGRVHGDGLSAGGLLSVRRYDAARENRVAGADLLWRRTDEEQVRVRALGSQTTALFDADGAPSGGAREDGRSLWASWWRRTPGWNLTAEAAEISPRFRNDNGFVEQAGVRSVQAEAVRRFGEVALPGIGFYEFEAYLWAQQRTALADPREGVAGGELVSRRIHPGLWWVAAYNTEASIEWRAHTERVKPVSAGGQAHDTHTVALSYGVNPAPWFTRFTAELEWGQRIDVEADRVGRGAVWLLEAKLRGGLPNGWGVESEQRAEQGFVRGPDGRRALTDTALQWLAVLHLDARDSVRAVWQRHRIDRTADDAAGLVSARERDTVFSLVAQHRIGLGRVFSVGMSRQRPGVAAPKDTEVFLKAAFAVEL